MMAEGLKRGGWGGGMGPMFSFCLGDPILRCTACV